MDWDCPLCEKYLDKIEERRKGIKMMIVKNTIFENILTYISDKND